MVTIPYVESKCRLTIKNISIPLVDSYSKDGKTFKTDKRTFSIRLRLKCGDTELFTPVIINANAKIMNIEFPENDYQPSDFNVEIAILALRTDNFAKTNKMFDKFTNSLSKSIGMNTLNKYNNGDFPHVLDNPTSDVTEMMKTVATVTYQLKHAGGYKAIVQRVKRTEHFISEPNLCPPLFGTLSANIVCQPHSLNKPLSQGFANAKLCLQQRTLKNVYCTLKGGTLTIFNTKPRDSKDGTIEIPVNNDTLLHIDKRFDSVVLSAAISKTEMVKELVLDFQKQREMEDWCQALSTQINDTKVYGDNATTDFDTYKNKEGEMSPFAVYETLLTSKGHIPKYLFGSVNALNYNEGEGKYSVGYKNNKIKPSKYPHTFNCHSIENKKPNRATAASVFENCPQPIATISNKPNSFQRTAIKGKRHPEIKCGTLISMSNNLRTKKMGIETTRL